jgi:hypothetical protein
LLWLEKNRSKNQSAPQLPFSHCIDIGYRRGRRQLDLRFYFRRMIGRSYVG